MDVAAFIDLAHIASLEVTVFRELFSRLLGHAPVALEHVGALDLDAADLAHGQVFAVVALHAQADARQGEAHGAATALILALVALVSGVGVAGEHDGFAHAVAFQNGVAGALLPFLEGFDEQRCRACDEQAHVLHSLFVQTCLGQHAHVQRGHAHEHCGAGHGGDDGLGVELGHPDHLAAVDERAVDGDEQAVDVEDGQCVDEHIPLLPAPVVLEHDSVAQHVAVREHGALAAAGGAAGVEDGGQVVGTAGHGLMLIAVVGGALEQAAGAVVAQGENMLRAQREGNLADPAEVAGRAHHHRGLGVADEVFDLGALVGGVERQKHVACAQRGQVQGHGFDGLFHLHGHSAALGQLERCEQVGDAGAGAVQVAPGVEQRGAVCRHGLDGGAVQVRREGCAQGAEEVVLAHGSWTVLKVWINKAGGARQNNGARFSRNAVMPSRCSALSA
ncbi:hypothetical protein D3C71_1228180 [compost metagenome]